MADTGDSIDEPSKAVAVSGTEKKQERDEMLARTITSGKLRDEMRDERGKSTRCIWRWRRSTKGGETVAANTTTAVLGTTAADGFGQSKKMTHIISI
ncbi:hypothetical protein LINGRAHAP2_LOCUS34531 [Linum grandiflorum]